MSSLHRNHPAALIGALLCALVLAACGKQGEGERCDLNSGSLDCEVGLVCRSADQLSLQGQQRGWALCCPPDDSVPTVNACRAGAQLPDDDGEVPTGPTPSPDGGTPAGDGGT
ncbi:MAG TPA: hypothetical protein VMG12_32790 [Polyangiaceae bacterium]|nr:hypothetical protein [Polyangiaceae bacterium]